MLPSWAFSVEISLPHLGHFARDKVPVNSMTGDLLLHLGHLYSARLRLGNFSINCLATVDPCFLK